MGFGVRGSEEPAGSSARSPLPCPVAETVAPRVKLPIPHPQPPAPSSLAPGFGRFMSSLEECRAAFLLLRWPTSLGMTASRFMHPVAGGKTFSLFQGRVILRGTHVLRPRPPGRRGRLGRSRAVVDAGRRPRPEGAIPCPRAHSGVGLPAAQPFRPELFLRDGPPRPPPRPLHRTRSPPGRGFRVLRVLRALASPCFAVGASLAGRWP